MTSPTLDDVFSFCFEDTDRMQWFTKDPAFDQVIHQRFATTLEQAAKGELYHWRQTAHGRATEIFVLDQFSRNLYRDTPQAFAQDTMALVLAQELVASGALDQFPERVAGFVLMPYMHSESVVIHEQAVELFTRYAPGHLEAEMKHKVIVDRFHRYPHRNNILGRESTTEEQEFLTQPDSSFL